jgi:hypothetical protein
MPHPMTTDSANIKRTEKLNQRFKKIKEVHPIAKRCNAEHLLLPQRNYTTNNFIYF